MSPDLDCALVALRAGDDGAPKAFSERFLYLLDGQPPEQLGPMFVAMSDAVDRIAKNAITAGDVEDFIKRELWRANKDYGREASPHIAPPRTTNRTRELKNQPVYGKLRRRRGSDQMAYNPDQEFIERAGHLNTTPKVKVTVTDEGGEEFVPARLIDNGADDDLREALATTRIERDVMHLLADGHTREEIASVLAIKPGMVRVVQNRIRERAVRLGYKLPK